MDPRTIAIGVENIYVLTATKYYKKLANVLVKRTVNRMCRNFTKVMH